MKNRFFRVITIVISVLVIMSSFNITFPVLYEASGAGIDFLDDELDNLDKTYDYGLNLAFETYKPQQFEFDFSRVKSNSGNDSWIIWNYDSGITEFGVVTYWSEAVGDITVSVSKDNTHWVTLSNNNVTDTELSTDWYKRVFKYYGISNTYKYVKLFLGNQSAGITDTNVSISRVRINNIDSMEDLDRCVEDRAAVTYYIDPQKGSNYNIGTLETKPYKNFKNLVGKYFGPGDKILLKSGCSLKGNLILRGMGSEAAPITIGTYGGDEKAKLSSNDGNTLSISMQYVTIENLEITNPNGMMGIYIIPNATGQNNNITVRNCYLHDINIDQKDYNPGRYEHGGIIVMVDGIEPTWINNLCIENNVIENTSRCGIFTSSEWAYRPGIWGRQGHYINDDNGWYPFTDTVIRQNTVNSCRGDSILVTCAKNTLVEKNTVVNGFDNVNDIKGIASASVWGTNTNDTVYQYNEVSYTNLPLGCADGEAFDIDISSVRNIVQYNYTHDNEGGFLLMCNNDEGAAVSGGHIVRFNLSVDDGSTVKVHAPFMIEGANPDTHIYNNTVYMNGITDTIVEQYSCMGTLHTEDFRFTNNIFCGVDGETFKFKTTDAWVNTLFDNNVFCNADVEGLENLSGITVTNPIIENPEFANPDINLATANHRDVIMAFTPQNNMGEAIDIENNGGKDITGRKFDEIDFLGCIKYNYTYTNSFKVNVPYSLTDAKGNALTVKIDIADNLVSATTGTDHRRIWWNTFVGDPTGWTDGSITADTSIPLVGYNIQKSDGSSGSSGMATYYSMSAIKDIRFDTSYSIDDEYWIAEPLEFFASSDGVNFNKIDTVRKTVGDAFTRNVCNGMYAQIYDSYTFAEEEDIHFIKVISTIKDENNDFSKQINRIYAIDYTAFPRDEITYKRSLDVTNAYSITDLNGDSSTVKFDIAASLAGAASDITDHRRIWWGTIVDNPTGWTADGIPADTSVPLIGYNLKTLDGTSGASGAVTYYIPSAVKDIRFDNCYTVDDNNWVAKPLQFYVSSDGINFREIEPETTACGTEFTYPHYLGANSQIYDEYSFIRSDDIHFVRIISTINAVGNSLTTAVNRIYGIDYNTYIDYSTIISGDANDDGNVDIRDLIHEKVHLSDNTKPLKNFYAADYNRDLVFDTLDMVWLKKALLGLV